GTQDRTHVVRIGDLIEHEHDSCRLELLEFVRGQGLDFGQQSVVYGAGAKAARDSVRPDDFRLDGERHAFVGKAPRRIRGGIKMPDAARGIFQRRFYRVPPVENRSAAPGLLRFGRRSRTLALPGGWTLPLGRMRTVMTHERPDSPARRSQYQAIAGSCDAEAAASARLTKRQALPITRPEHASTGCEVRARGSVPSGKGGGL